MIDGHSSFQRIVGDIGAIEELTAALKNYAGDRKEDKKEGKDEDTKAPKVLSLGHDSSPKRDPLHSRAPNPWPTFSTRTCPWPLETRN